MKLGVFTVVLDDKPLDEALAYLQSLGVQMIELGAGGYPGTKHCNPDVLLHDDSAFKIFEKTVRDSGLEISALSCHGNPIHPNKAVAADFQKGFENTVLMAEKLCIKQINTFSGCPGDGAGSSRPNWVTCAWPNDFGEILKYQWNDVLIPYWKEAVKFASSHGVNKIALELHPGFCVYNTDTMLRLRDAVGESIGANFDPSHLFWQGMDPCVAIRELKDCIFHFHAKDTNINKENTARKGVLDTSEYTNALERSWIFRTVGYGHDVLTWNNIVSTLRMVGYDYAISIEHEDALMSRNEGLEKGVKFLQGILFNEPLPQAWWA